MMVTQSPDTHPEIEKVQISLLRNLTVTQRVAKVRSLSATVIALSRRAVRRTHPDLDERELLLKCLSYHYGEKLADQVRNYMDSKLLNHYE